MRLIAYVVACLLSAMSWALAYDGARVAYHSAQQAEIVPNLHIRTRIRSIPARLARIDVIRLGFVR